MITEPVVLNSPENLTQPSHDRSKLSELPANLEHAEDAGGDGVGDMGVGDMGVEDAGGYEEVEEVGNNDIIVEGRQP